MDIFLYLIHPVQFTVTGPSEGGKFCFPTNLFTNIINDSGKIYIYSRFLHEHSLQKLFNCFTNFVPKNIFEEILNEDDLDVLKEAIFIEKNFVKSKKKDTYESMKEMNDPRGYNSGSSIVKFSDDLNEKKWMILDFKQCLNDLDSIVFLFL